MDAFGVCLYDTYNTYKCMHVFFVQSDLIESMCFSNDGYIVCEEHQEILKAAWENEQDIQQKKEQEVCCCFFCFFFVSVIDFTTASPSKALD